MTYDKYTEQAEIVTRTGQDSWDDVREWFGNMSVLEIRAECDRCWPGDNNAELAERIYNAL